MASLYSEKEWDRFISFYQIARTISIKGENNISELWVVFYFSLWYSRQFWVFIKKVSSVFFNNVVLLSSFGEQPRPVVITCIVLGIASKVLVNILRKSAPHMVRGHRETKMVQTGKLPSCVIALLVPGSTMSASGNRSQQPSYPAVRSVSWYNDWPGKTCPCVHYWHQPSSDWS